MANFPAAFDKEVILAVHSYSIKRFGGADGIRDLDLLESAIAQPFQTFDDTDLYLIITGFVRTYVDKIKGKSLSSGQKVQLGSDFLVLGNNVIFLDCKTPDKRRTHLFTCLKGASIHPQVDLFDHFALAHTNP